MSLRTVSACRCGGPYIKVSLLGVIPNIFPVFLSLTVFQEAASPGLWECVSLTVFCCYNKNEANSFMDIFLQLTVLKPEGEEEGMAFTEGLRTTLLDDRRLQGKRAHEERKCEVDSL